MELDDAMAFVRTWDQGLLATIRRDGRPQLSNITYAVAADGVIRISVTDSRAKTANARRDPRVALHVTSQDFYAYVVIEGRAELTPAAGDPGDATVDELVEYYRAVRGEHPDWDEFRRAMVADRRLVLRVHPERAYGMLPGGSG
jgi:PPOX class probable F420-dependent enzyme